MPKSETVRLLHMLDAARKIVEFTQGRSRLDLDRDEMLALAVLRLMEILGEAAKNVPDRLRTQHPEIAWRQLAGVRDRLIHAYFDVDLDIVWAIATQNLPPLIPFLEALVASQRDRSRGES